MGDPRKRRGPRARPRRSGIPSVVASTRPVDTAAARAAAAARHERRVGAVLEIDLDECLLDFGASNAFGTCTATGEPCHHAFTTCKDKANYRKGVHTWRFCTRGMTLPAGEPMRPYIPLNGIKIAPSEIDPAKGLALRSRTMIEMGDEPDSDVEADPYIAQRSAAAQGTFWTRLLARNRNYQGRPARLKRGFITTPWSWDTFQTEHYIIESIKGPDARGGFRVELSDKIRFLDHVDIPPATDGKLTADLPATSDAGTAQAGGAATITLRTEASTVDGFYVGHEAALLENTGAGQRRVISGYVGATRVATVSVAWSVQPDNTTVYETAPLSLTLDTGKGDKYPDPAGTGGLEFVRIGEETIRYSAKSGDTLSWADGTYRAQFGTVRADHDEDDGVQICQAWIDKHPTVVLKEICNKGQLQDEFIDLAGLEEESEAWLSIGANITACIASPTRAGELAKDLLIDMGFFGWWDAIGNLFRFKANKPAQAGSVTALTDDDLMQGVECEVLDSERITRAITHYNLRSATANLKEAKSYANDAEARDSDAEDPVEYGDVRPERRYSRWLTAANATFALANASRTLARRRDAPRRLRLSLDHRNEKNLGDSVTVTTRAMVDRAGNPVATNVRITRKKDLLTHLELEARTTGLDKRYGFIAPAGHPDYADADDAERLYAFICDTGGLMSDGTDGYVIS